MWLRLLVLLMLEAWVVGCRGDRPSSSPRPQPSSVAIPPTPAPADVTPPTPRECLIGRTAAFGYSLDEIALPAGTAARALAVTAGRVWILTPDTLIEHDGKRVYRETALCGGDLRADDRSVPSSTPIEPAPLPGYRYVAADEHGALALGTSGARMLVSRVDADGQLHCRESPGIYPVSPISEDGVWLARTRIGVEVQDETGWRSEGLVLGAGAIVYGVARRGHALLQGMNIPRVHELAGDSWRATGLPGMFFYDWMSDRGVVFARSIPTISTLVGGSPTGPPCELIARIERGKVRFIPLPDGFRPNAIVGRREGDLWFTGHWTTLHWDGAIWREADPKFGAAGGVVDEDGAFWFVGAGSSGAQHSSVYRVRRR